MDAKRLEELKRLAQKATPGPWERDDVSIMPPVAMSGPDSDGSRCVLARVFGDYGAPRPPWTGYIRAGSRDANAAFIAAANPATVLELVAHIEALEAEQRTLRDAVFEEAASIADREAARDERAADTDEMAQGAHLAAKDIARFIRARKADTQSTPSTPE